MPSPQLENGFLRLANEIVDALIAYRLPGEQMQCLLFILRKTYGYGKKEDMISNSQFCEATGMKKGNVSRAVKGLVDKNIVIKNDNTRMPTYRFNKYYRQWKVLSKKQPVIKSDNRLLSKVMDTKDNYTKDIINPPIIPPADPPPKKKPERKFIPPSVEEVFAYCQERGNGIDPEQFVDSYTAKGWMIGKNKMKDWRAAVRTWEKNGHSNGRSGVKATTVHQANMMARDQMAKMLNDEADHETRRKSCGKNIDSNGNQVPVRRLHS